MSVLEKRLRELIAEEDGIAPEDVTLVHIHDKRDVMYADAAHKFDEGTEYGGYDVTGLEVNNQVAVEQERVEAQTILRRFRRREHQALQNDDTT